MHNGTRCFISVWSLTACVEYEIKLNNGGPGQLGERSILTSKKIVKGGRFYGI